MTHTNQSLEAITVDIQGHTAILTLNRPPVNAINRHLIKQLGEMLDQYCFTKQIRSIVIIGQGDKAFCAGADLKERKTLSESEVKQYIHSIRTLFSRIEHLEKPVIAAINGVALGGGLELALCCDLRLAAQSAILGLPETKLAIIPGAGGTQRLSRIVGLAKAKELIYLAKKITASEALQIGLLNTVVPNENVLTEALSICESINECGPLAISQAKFAINQGFNLDMATALALETKAYETLIPTRDRVEALNAFIEKRPAQFIGE